MGDIESTKTFNDLNILEQEDLTKILYRIAFINIKKTAGRSVLDFEAFYKYCKDENAIEKGYQNIDKIKPDIIMCGNIFHYLHPGLSNFKVDKDWINKGGI